MNRGVSLFFRSIYTCIITAFLLPVIISAQSIGIQLGDTSLPYKVYNTEEYFPPIIAQIGESCGSASGIGYVFNYEINAIRAADPSDAENIFPYKYTFNFLNDGSSNNGTHTMFLDAWNIVRNNGIMNQNDFGDIERRSTKWVSGYEKYYRGMQNRIAAIDSFSFHDDNAFATMKQWLYDHGNGSEAGGIFTITVGMQGAQVVSIDEGEHAGMAIVHSFAAGESPGGKHDLTVVGYNDSIRHDFNYDGQITNDIDLNGDTEINVADYETGAFVAANSWGPMNWSEGFAFVPYRLFVTASSDGGTLTNKAYYITVHKAYRPQRTFKVGLSHHSRDKAALSVGIAADTSATEPEYVRKIEQFSNKGGSLPMCGYDASDSIEIGLDVSDLLDSISGNRSAAYFLCFTMDDANGACNGFSLFDYSDTSPAEIISTEAPSPLPKGFSCFKLIAPKAGISLPDNPAPPLSQLSFNYHHGMITFPPLPTPGMITICHLNGELIENCLLPRNATSFSLPRACKSGIYSIRFTGSRNNTIIRTIPVLK